MFLMLDNLNVVSDVSQGSVLGPFLFLLDKSDLLNFYRILLCVMQMTLSC